MVLYIPRRIIISFLLFCMFIITNYCNNGLNISIISMIEHDISPSNTTSSTKFDQNKLHWNALSIAVVQGAYFWGYCITKLPGGILSRRYGSRKVLMIGAITASIVSFLFPTAAKINPICGITWPAAINLGTAWIPKGERSTFAAIFHGNALSVVIFFPISGFLISYFGWESMFYLCGILCFIWSIFWYYYAYDSPHLHPHISLEEKAYLDVEINDAVNNVAENKKCVSSIPWKSILTSKPFWAAAIYFHGNMWAILSINIQLPKYFSNFHKVDIKMSGIMVGLPGICKVIFGILFGIFIDYLIKQKKCSITFARKLSTITSKIITGIIILVLAFNINSNHLYSVLLISIYFIFNGTYSSAAVPNLSDIAPNFAGILVGLIQTSIFIPGILSPLIYSTILSLNPNNGWFWIFIIIACIEIFSGIVFLIYCSGEVQDWNKIKVEDKDIQLNEESKKFIQIKT